MIKIFIIAAVFDFEEPDEPEEHPPVPKPKPTPQDTFLRRLIGEVRKEHHPDFWENFHGTFFKG